MLLKGDVIIITLHCSPPSTSLSFPLHQFRPLKEKVFLVTGSLLLGGGTGRNPLMNPFSLTFPSKHRPPPPPDPVHPLPLPRPSMGDVLDDDWHEEPIEEEEPVEEPQNKKVRPQVEHHI